MDRLFRPDIRKGSPGIAWEDLSAKYDELLRLRQRVKIAECGRAIGHARSVSPTCDQFHASKAS